MSRSSSSTCSRKLHPLKQLLTKLQSKLSQLDRVIRNRTNRIITHVFPHNNNSNRHISLVRKPPSYQLHSHYNYISDYYSTNRNNSNREILLHKKRNKNVSAVYIDHLYSEEATSSIFDFNANSNLTALTAAAEPAKTAADKAKTTTEAAGKEMVISTYSASYTRPPLPRVNRSNNSNGGGDGATVDQTVVQRRRKKKEAAPVVIVDEKNSGYNSVETLEDAWREVVARSPQLRPVEVRTEEFVYQFQKIQRADLSIVEMLAAGSY